MSNISSAQVVVEALLQIPQGSVPLIGGKIVDTVRMSLSRYETSKQEYFFYFPRLGSFNHYPLHVECKGELVAFAAATPLTVVNDPTSEDNSSWSFVSTRGTNAALLAYLKDRNVRNVRLQDIAWRLANSADLTQRVLGLLSQRGIYEPALFKYAVKHGLGAFVAPVLAETIGRRVGPVGSYPLLDFAGEEGVADGSAGGTGVALAFANMRTGSYEHLEYEPLVNARAHVLGGRRAIMNQSLAQQYDQLLDVITRKPAPTANDLMAVTYHLVAQDRLEDAKAAFARVPVPTGSALAEGGSSTAATTTSGVVWTTLQYDYMAAYLDFTNDNPSVARKVAAAYPDYPVKRWADRFKEIREQLAEVDGGAPADADAAVAAMDSADHGTSKSKAMEALARKEPALEMRVSGDGKSLEIESANLSSVTLRFYKMDIELLFSTAPFAQGSGTAAAERFGLIRPNLTTVVSELGEGGTTTVPIPSEFDACNVMVEATAAGLTVTKSRFATSMRVTTVPAYGRVKAVDAATGRPLPRVYVKVSLWRLVTWLLLLLTCLLLVVVLLPGVLLDKRHTRAWQCPVLQGWLHLDHWHV